MNKNEDLNEIPTGIVTCFKNMFTGKDNNPTKADKKLMKLLEKEIGVKKGHVKNLKTAFEDVDKKNDNDNDNDDDGYDNDNKEPLFNSKLQKTKNSIYVRNVNGNELPPRLPSRKTKQVQELPPPPPPPLPPRLGKEVAPAVPPPRQNRSKKQKHDEAPYFNEGMGGSDLYSKVKKRETDNVDNPPPPPPHHHRKSKRNSWDKLIENKSLLNFRRIQQFPPAIAQAIRNEFESEIDNFLKTGMEDVAFRKLKSLRKDSTFCEVIFKDNYEALMTSTRDTKLIAEYNDSLDAQKRKELEKTTTTPTPQPIKYYGLSDAEKLPKLQTKFLNKKKKEINALIDAQNQFNIDTISTQHGLQKAPTFASLERLINYGDEGLFRIALQSNLRTTVVNKLRELNGFYQVGANITVINKGGGGGRNNDDEEERREVVVNSAAAAGLIKTILWQMNVFPEWCCTAYELCSFLITHDLLLNYGLEECTINTGLDVKGGLVNSVNLNELKRQTKCPPQTDLNLVWKNMQIGLNAESIRRAETYFANRDALILGCSELHYFLMQIARKTLAQASVNCQNYLYMYFEILRKVALRKEENKMSEANLSIAAMKVLESGLDSLVVINDGFDKRKFAAVKSRYTKTPLSVFVMLTLMGVREGDNKGGTGTINPFVLFDENLLTLIENRFSNLYGMGNREERRNSFMRRFLSREENKNNTSSGDNYSGKFVEKLVRLLKHHANPEVGITTTFEKHMDRLNNNGSGAAGFVVNFESVFQTYYDRETRQELRIDSKQVTRQLEERQLDKHLLEINLKALKSNVEFFKKSKNTVKIHHLFDLPKSHCWLTVSNIHKSFDTVLKYFQDGWKACCRNIRNLKVIRNTGTAAAAAETVVFMEEINIENGFGFNLIAKIVRSECNRAVENGKNVVYFYEKSIFRDDDEAAPLGDHLVEVEVEIVYRLCEDDNRRTVLETQSFLQYKNLLNEAQYMKHGHYWISRKVMEILCDLKAS